MDTPTMTIIDYLEWLITKAMKDGDKDMLAIYRIAKTEMINQQKQEGIAASAIDKDKVFKTIKKRLLEEIDSLEKVGRDTTSQHKQLDWVISELPAPVSEEEIRMSVKEYLNDYPDTNIGKIMGHLKLIYHGKTLDMQLASKIAKDALENK